MSRHAYIDQVRERHALSAACVCTRVCVYECVLLSCRMRIICCISACPLSRVCMGACCTRLLNRSDGDAAVAVAVAVRPRLCVAWEGRAYACAWWVEWRGVKHGTGNEWEREGTTRVCGCDCGMHAVAVAVAVAVVHVQLEVWVEDVHAHAHGASERRE